MQNTAIQYRPDIDGLRTIAVLIVIFYHGNIKLFSGGYVGVDVFFVISGYLITSIIVKKIQSNTFSFKDFYTRRAKRILPALIFLCFSIVPFAYLALMPSQLVRFAWSIISSLGSFSNILFYSESGYFDALSFEKPLLHTWSLSVEEQFYLITPPLLLLLYRCLPKRRILITLIAIAAISIYSSVNTDDNSLNFYMLHTRYWELFSGSILAISFVSLRKLSNNLYDNIGKFQDSCRIVLCCFVNT